MIVGSILLGISTHLLWDSFTHPNTWLYCHWSLLSQPLDLPLLGPVPVYKILQHTSTIVGTGILLIWGVLRYRAIEPSGEVLASGVSSVRKIAVSAIVTIVALAGSLVRAFVAVGIPRGNAAEKQFVGLLVITGIALVWWQLVVYGVLSARGFGRPTTLMTYAGRGSDAVLACIDDTRSVDSNGHPFLSTYSSQAPAA